MIACATGLAGPVFAEGEPTLALPGWRADACDVSGTRSSLAALPWREERIDCERAVGFGAHTLRVSHLGDSAGDVQLLPSRFHGGRLLSQAEASADHAPTFGPDLGAASELELSGRWDRFRYEFEMGLSRDERDEGGHFDPERIGESSLKTTLDFGLVRSRFELAGSHRVEELDALTAEGSRGDRTQTSAGVGRVFLDLALPEMPILTLGAGRELKTIDRGRGERIEQATSDVVSGTLWYGRPRWQAYAASSLYTFRGADGESSGSVLYDHFASASFWPTPTLTINPDVQYSTARFGEDDDSLSTLVASLGIYSTGIWERGVLSLWGGYTQSRDTADRVDYRQLDLALGAERSLGSLPGVDGYEVTLGAKLAYSRYDDFVNPSAGVGAYRSLLTLRITAD